MASSSALLAGSATWNTTPIDGDWDNASNWTPNTVPNGPLDVATFNDSQITDLGVSSDIEVSQLIFNPGASNFTLQVSNFLVFEMSGKGITNNSGVTQTFVCHAQEGENPGGLTLSGNATAGSNTVFICDAPINTGATRALEFIDHATGGEASFTIHGSNIAGVNGGEAMFFGNSVAGGGTFVNEGGSVAGAAGGATLFFNQTHAQDGVLIAQGGTNGGGGGLIGFFDSSAGDSARVEVFGNGFLDVSDHGAISIGSLEGDGLVLLANNKLTVGGNGLSTTFSGTMQDGGPSSGLVKTGAGMLTLAGASTYTGGTTVSQGTLVVSNTSGSATGTGPVSVNASTLGGSGIIAGAVTVGTGSGTGAFLAPAHGGNKQLTLTIQGSLTFNSDATYTYTFKARGNKSKVDKVIANEVTINSGATINLSGTTQGQLTQGMVMTLIKNTAAPPIAGTFSNLPDGGIVTINGNNFQASYEGGDGNDLTLTVVP